jgi:hypothetical protein
MVNMVTEAMVASPDGDSVLNDAVLAGVAVTVDQKFHGEHFREAHLAGAQVQLELDYQIRLVITLS